MLQDFFVIQKDNPALNPVNCGYEDCRPSHSFGPAVRMYWLIHFVESGFGSFKIGGKTYMVGPGEMFVIPPYVETYYEADDKKPWSYIWIGFTADRALPVELSDTVYCPRAQKVFSDIKNCIENENARSAYLSARLWDMFAILLESAKKDTDYVEIALNCIHSEYMNDINVNQLAARLSLDRSYFSTIFKEKTGTSPGKYLFNLRMNTAADLMVNRSKSIATAANSVGYTDIYNFSRMFKRHFGLSPRAYVEAHKK